MLCYQPCEREREGEDGKGARGRGREVPRSLGDVLDDKRGMRGDNSGRRRRDVQNMWNEMISFGWSLECFAWSCVNVNYLWTEISRIERERAVST